MAGFAARLGGLVLALALGGCVLPGAGGGGGGGKAPVPNPVTGGEIEVSALDAPAPEAVAVAAATPVPAPSAVPAAPAAASAPAVAADPAPAPAVAKSPEQIACEKKKGSWAKAGKAGFACIFPTRDSGKACRKGADCEGLCLARSGTCAPIKPLFGCNEILDDMGRRMSLCVD